MTPTKRTVTLFLGLTLMANAADFFASISTLWIIMRSKLSIDQYFGNAFDLLFLNNWSNFVTEKGALALAAISIFVSFSLGKMEGKKMFGVAQTLFPKSKTPTRFSGVAMLTVVPLVVLGYLVNLFLMALFIDNILVLPVLVSAVYVISLPSIKLQHRYLFKFLDDPRYNPSLQSDDHGYIMKSREVVRRYYQDNYHVSREMISFAACLVIFVISWKVGPSVPWQLYILISMVVLASEFVVYRWRNARDVALLIIQNEEAVEV